MQVILGGLAVLASLAGGVWAVMRTFAYLVAKVVAQFKAQLDERFEALERAREDGRKAWDERFAKVEARYEQLDRELRKLLIELPDRWVRREDYVRRETLIEAKIDQLSLRIQNWILESRND